MNIVNFVNLFANVSPHISGSPKLQIEKLQSQCRVCVISKPPQTRLISKSKKLGEITEEDEEKAEVEETAPKVQTQILTLNASEDPQKRFQAIIYFAILVSIS